MSDDQKKERVLFDFTTSADSDWMVVNDVVMGGVSRSGFQVLDDSTALFSGHVSLENNGGFASTRTQPEDFDLKGYEEICIRVKGDGKRYSFRIRTDDDFDGIAYKSDFDTEKDRWMEIRLPFPGFKPTFRGRILNTVSPLQPDRIRQVGFLISEKQEGAFSLYIDWIKAR